MFSPKQFNPFFTLILITLAFFLSNCSKDENEETVTSASSVSGIIKGTVLDNETDALSGVSVTFAKSGTTSSTVTTLDNGTFSESSLSSGTYTLTYNKSGFVDTTLSATLTADDETLEVVTVKQLSDMCASTGAISGTIKDAMSNSGVTGVSLSARSGLNTTSGTIVQTATSDSSGDYSLNSMSKGWYTVETSKSGYIAANNFYVYSCGDNASSQDATITTTLSSGSMRIILSWNTNKDLDSHLTGPDNASGKFHVYYSKKKFYYAKNTSSCSGCSDSQKSDNVTQNVDSTKGNGKCNSCGPETITISSVRSGTYRYYVHNFTNAGTNNKRLFKSGAFVTVYYDGLSNNPTTFTVPGTQGDLWTVFDFNTSSGLTAVGAMGSEELSRKVDDH